LNAQQWLTESLRFTLFPSEPFERQDWWQDVVGEPADEERNNPKVGLFQQSGDFENGVLRLSVQPSRIDWTWAPVITEAFEHQHLGSFDDCSTKFFALVDRWLQKAPSCKRLAYGPVLLLPVSAAEDGYKKLMSFLKLNLDYDGAKEFLLQINRPRSGKTSIQGLRVNRLTTWSVQFQKKVEFSLEPESNSYLEKNLLYACRLQMDINNAAVAKLPVERLSDLTTEFRELSFEIAEKGDCK